MKKRWIPILAVLVVGGFFFLGCEDDPEEAEITTVEVSPGSASIFKDETQQFAATVLDQDGSEMSGVSVSWASSDESVATVDAIGQAIGVGEGSSTISATANGASGSGSLTVSLTTEQLIVGTWTADSTQGDMGNATLSSGSLAGAGWTTYELTLSSDGSFSATGANPYDIYGESEDIDGTVNYSGTYTIDHTQTPMEIDLTCTLSDLELFFPTTAEVQPLQNGIFELNDDNTELTVQYGAELAFGVPRPTEFLTDSLGVYDCGTLVKQ